MHDGESLSALKRALVFSEFAGLFFMKFGVGICVKRYRATSVSMRVDSAYIYGF